MHELGLFQTYLTEEAKVIYNTKLKNTIIEWCTTCNNQVEPCSVCLAVSAVIKGKPCDAHNCVHPGSSRKLLLVRFIAKQVLLSSVSGVERKYVKVLARVFVRLVESKKVVVGVLSPASFMEIAPIDNSGELLVETVTGWVRQSQLPEPFRYILPTEGAIAELDVPIVENPQRRGLLFLYPCVAEDETTESLNKYLEGEFFAEEGSACTSNGWDSFL